jgi:uncharacterized protein
MNLMTILIILLCFIVYCLLCLYIGYNGWVWLKSIKLEKYKIIYMIFVMFLSLTMLMSPFIPLPYLEIVSGVWMAILAFGVIFFPVANLVFFLFKKKGVYWIGLSLIFTFFIILGIGYYNAWNPVVRTYEVGINKKSELSDLKILMATDFHLGPVVGVDHLEKFVDIVEEEKPDIILLPGDIINDHIETFLEEDMSEVMAKIDAPLGVYAVLGNHDYYGDDMEELLSELDRIGIEVLMDEYVKVEEYFYVVGRKELTDESRAGLPEYMGDVDSDLPIIMMDHQPVDFDIAQDSEVDLHLAGHTHGGQIFPANLITGIIFENDWGYLQKGNFHSIVSSGFGLWGPPLRVGTRSEAVVINVEFGK